MAGWLELRVFEIFFVFIKLIKLINFFLFTRLVLCSLAPVWCARVGDRCKFSHGQQPQQDPQQQQPQQPKLPELLFPGDLNGGNGFRIVVAQTLDDLTRGLGMLTYDANGDKFNPSCVFGFDIEWEPNRVKGSDNPPAVLQLSSYRTCLVVQLLYFRPIPWQLADFLASSNFCKVGLGINGDRDRLMRHYNIGTANTVDLADLAQSNLINLPGRTTNRSTGLALLANHFIPLAPVYKQFHGREMRKSTRVQCSNWSAALLTMEQVLYAATDAWAAVLVYNAMLVSLGSSEQVTAHEGPSAEDKGRFGYNEPMLRAEAPHSHSQSHASTAVEKERVPAQYQMKRASKLLGNIPHNDDADVKKAGVLLIACYQDINNLKQKV